MKSEEYLAFSLLYRETHITRMLTEGSLQFSRPLEAQEVKDIVEAASGEAIKQFVKLFGEPDGA